MRTKMGLPLRYQLLAIHIVTNVIVCGDPGPGAIYYRQPTKLVFYKKYPPVLIYPKKTDYDSVDVDLPTLPTYPTYEKNGGIGGYAYSAPKNGLPDNQHVKYGKYFLLNPHFLNHLIQYEEEKYYLKKVEKNPMYDNWLAWLLDIKSKKPSTSISYSSQAPGPPTSYAHFDSKFTEPVYTYHAYHPRKPLNIVPQHHQHHKHVNEDVKPVVEHIEDDIKYDFRTKTHSYDR